MSKKKKIIIAVIVAVVVIVAAVAAVIIVKSKGSAGVSDSGVYADKVSDVMYASVTSTNRYTGVVEAADTLDIKKDSDKTVKEVLVSEGDTVEVGTPLFTYDVEELTQKRDSAKLELESLQNDLEGYNAQIDQLTTEKKSASKDQQLDYTLQIQQIQTQQKQCQYNIASKQSEVTKYDDSINNATVTSTMAGLVKQINNDDSESYDSSSSDAFITIISTGEYRVKGKIDEQSYYSSGISEGMSVIVRSRTDDEQTWLGTISKIDTDNPQSGTDSNSYSSSDSSESASKYYFYVELSSSSDMLLGQHVFVEPDYGQSEVKEGIWIDESYVVQDGDSAYVWAKNDKNKLEKREVELGEYDDSLLMYQIVSGLSEDDYIVWASDDLYEGESASTWEDYDFSDDATTDNTYTDDSYTDDSYTDDSYTDDESSDDGTTDDAITDDYTSDDSTTVDGAESNTTDDATGVE